MGTSFHHWVSSLDDSSYRIGSKSKPTLISYPNWSDFFQLGNKSTIFMIINTLLVELMLMIVLEFIRSLQPIIRMGRVDWGIDNDGSYHGWAKWVCKKCKKVLRLFLGEIARAVSFWLRVVWLIEGRVWLLCDWLKVVFGFGGIVLHFTECRVCFCWKWSEKGEIIMRDLFCPHYHQIDWFAIGYFYTRVC